MTHADTVIVPLPDGSILRPPHQYVASLGDANIATITPSASQQRMEIAISATPQLICFDLDDYSLRISRRMLHLVSLELVSHCESTVVALTLHFPHAGGAGVHVVTAPASSLDAMRSLMARLHPHLPCDTIDRTSTTR